MAKEIERKFLVTGTAWREDACGARVLRQGYLCGGDGVSVRVRLAEAGPAVLTIKAGARGPSRDEYEYEIPPRDGEDLLALCRGGIVEKTRHLVHRGGLVWEIDVFAGDNEGLVVAEVELERADQVFERPEWIGEEVTGDARYFNASLSRVPFSRWPAAG